jgi:hypothetical protein
LVSSWRIFGEYTGGKEDIRDSPSDLSPRRPENETHASGR